MQALVEKMFKEKASTSSQKPEFDHADIVPSDKASKPPLIPKQLSAKSSKL